MTAKKTASQSSHDTPSPAEAALRCSEERLRLIVEAGELGTWDRDLVTDATVWNDLLYDMLGRERTAPITGETFFAYIHPDDRARVHEHVEEQINDGEDFFDEFRIVREDGNVRWLAARGRVFRDAEGRPVRMAGVNFDISDRKRMEAEVAGLNRELERRVEERTRGLRMLSARLADAQEDERRRIAAGLHDEVCQLVAAAQIKLAQARDCPDGEERKQLLDDADRVLDEAGDEIRGLTFELSSTALFQAGFAAAARELCAHMSQRHGVAFTCECADDNTVVPESLRSSLYHCLRELLYNVVKHAGVETATVTIETADAARRLRITVRDYGKGFDPSDLDRPLTRKGGFGLHHLRKRMNDIGGELTIASVPGDGTKAVLLAPLG